MNEDRFELLNDYLDDALPPDERVELERRLETDPELAAELAELRGLVEAAAALPREAAPRRDLWPGIEGRLGSAKVVRFRRPGPDTAWPVAALAAAAALVIFVLVSNRDGEPDPAETQMAEVTETAPEDLSPEARLELEYAAASRRVLEGLGRNEELDPETVELIRRNLAIIDEAVREIREAIDASPDDARLHQQLNTEVRRRGDVLRQAADLSGSI
jgi:anti-sigma factor RsiW